MSKTRPPYPPEFCQRMVDLVRAGRTPEELAREYEPTVLSIRSWVAQANAAETKSQVYPNILLMKELSLKGSGKKLRSCVRNERS